MSKENVALADVTLRTAKVNQGNSYRQPLLPMMLSTGSQDKRQTSRLREGELLE